MGNFSVWLGSRLEWWHIAIIWMITFSFLAIGLAPKTTRLRKRVKYIFKLAMRFNHGFCLGCGFIGFCVGFAQGEFLKGLVH